MLPPVPKLPPVGLRVVAKPLPGKPGSFTVNGKEYRVDSLQLTDFGGTTYKECLADGQKMQDLAQVIEDTVNRMIQDGELDPNNMPDELSLEFSRKSIKYEPRTSYRALNFFAPDKKIENQHSFDTQTGFKIERVFLGSGKNRQEIAINSNEPHHALAGQRLTQQIATGVQFSGRNKKKAGPPHIQGFMLPTVVNGDCAIDAARQAMIQNGAPAHLTNDQIRTRASREIRTNPLFQQTVDHGGYFDAVLHALRDAQRDFPTKMTADRRLGVVQGLLANPALITTPARRAEIVQFYADYVRQPGVYMDLPFFLAGRTGTFTPFVILIRSEDGSQNPGYRVQAASPGATAANAIFVIHDGHNHYLAVDHSPASLARRQTIMTNYQRQQPFTQLQAHVAALDPTQITTAQQIRAAANHLYGQIQNLRIADPAHYLALRAAIQLAWIHGGVFIPGMEEEQLAMAIVIHIRQAQPAIAAL